MTDRPVYLLSPVVHEGTISLPMIGFSRVADTLALESADTLMFTSKQAVKTADAIDKRWREYPSVAIGGATKKQIESLGGTVIYHPKHFYGETLAEDIAAFFADRKILYLRPEEVSFDAKGFLAKKGIVLQEQVIYETRCIAYSKEKAPEPGAIIIFTSPSTIRCFFKSFRWDESYTAVVIGDATREHLPENVDFAVADEPLIASCIAKAGEILMTSNGK